MQDAYSNSQPKLIREKGKLAGMEAIHRIDAMSADVRCAATLGILFCR